MTSVQIKGAKEIDRNTISGYYHRHHLLILIPFLSLLSLPPGSLLRKRKKGEQRWRGRGLDSDVIQSVNGCKSRLSWAEFSRKLKDGWSAPPAPDNTTNICIWYIIQSPFLPPTTAACASHKPPRRSHEIRIFLSLSLFLHFLPHLRNFFIPTNCKRATNSFYPSHF